jgi:hypothetical protein
MPLEKLESYLYQLKTTPVNIFPQISISGGEPFAAYIKKEELDSSYIPNVAKTFFEYGYHPTFKTNGTWGKHDDTCKEVLDSIAQQASKYKHRIYLDISIDEFHNNLSGVSRIIYNTQKYKNLSDNLFITLSGFRTEKSQIALKNLYTELKKQGLNISPTDKLWQINNMLMGVNFTNSIFNFGRAKTKGISTANLPSYNDGLYCLEITYDDTATLNTRYSKPINNQHLSIVLGQLLLQFYKDR